MEGQKAIKINKQEKCNQFETIGKPLMQVNIIKMTVLDL